MRNYIILGLSALIASSPASANWQYTKWGMTPSEAIAASDGSLRSGDSSKSAQNGDTRDASGTYISGDRKFEASLWFRETRLTTVSLALRDDRVCTEILNDLMGKYGEPIERSGSSVVRHMWTDRDNGNRVEFVTTGLSYCQLKYEPLVSLDGEGL